MKTQNRIARCRSIAVWLVMFLLLCTVSAPLFAGASAQPPPAAVGAVFPRSLRSVSAEAFSGTALESIVFSDQLTEIGARAFAIERLRHVYLPESLQKIETGAISQTAVLHGAKDSYAQAWAEENGYTFLVEEIRRDRAPEESLRFERLLFLLCLVLPVRRVALLRRVRVFVRSMRPQDRPELYPIHYRFP